MEFFRENRKLIVKIIGISFIVFTIAPIAMMVFFGQR